jgi:hypothetical protein
MTERQLETVKGMKVADFLNNDEIQMFLDLRETAARCKAVPHVSGDIIDGLNWLLVDIHKQNNENGHRWADSINKDLATYFADVKARYAGAGSEV